MSFLKESIRLPEPQKRSSLPEMRRFAKCLALATEEKGEFLQQRYIDREVFLNKLKKYKLIEGESYLMEKCPRFIRIQRFIRERNKDLFSKIDFSLTLQDKVLIYKACVERLIQQYGPYPAGCEKTLPFITPQNRVECTILHIRKVSDDWIPPEWIITQIKSPEICRLLNLEEISPQKVRKKLRRTRNYEVENGLSKPRIAPTPQKEEQEKSLLPQTPVRSKNKLTVSIREKQTPRRSFVPILEIKIKKRTGIFDISGTSKTCSQISSPSESMAMSPQRLSKTESLENDEEIFERESSQLSTAGSNYTLPDIPSEERNFPVSQLTVLESDSDDTDVESRSSCRKRLRYEKEENPPESLDIFDNMEDEYPDEKQSHYSHFLIEDSKPKAKDRKEHIDTCFSWNSIF